MLSPFRVARLVASEEFDRLLNEVLMNARPVPLAARVRLSEQGALAASALGLALKRLTQLTWRPEPPAAELARQLIDRQSPDGAIGTPASTACAVAGLLALQEQVRSMPGVPGESQGLRGPGAGAGAGVAADTDVLPPGLLDSVNGAINAALEWLAHQPTAIGCAPFADDAARIGVAVRRNAAPDPDQSLDAAILIWQLGASPSAMDHLGIRSPAAVVDLLGLRHLRATAGLVDSIAESPAPAGSGSLEAARGAVRQAA